MRILHKSLVDDCLDHYDFNIKNPNYTAKDFAVAVTSIANRWFFYEHVKDSQYLAKDFTLQIDEKTDIIKIMSDLMWFKTITSFNNTKMKNKANNFYKLREEDLKDVASNMGDISQSIELFGDAMSYILSYTLKKITQNKVESNVEKINEFVKYKRDKEVKEIKVINDAVKTVVERAQNINILKLSMQEMGMK